MKKFNYTSKYDSYMDSEVVDLCNVINSLSGLYTTESCSGHNKKTLQIYFKIKSYQNHTGLFFLTRCIDRRYWKYGEHWSLKLSVSDVFDKVLPTNFMLESSCIGEEVYRQSIDLIENMEYHLNHKNFIEHYKIDLNKFNIKDQTYSFEDINFEM